MTDAGGWSLLLGDGETYEYAISAPDRDVVLIAWGDRAWATIFDRQPEQDRELVDFFVSGSKEIEAALTQIGLPEQSARRISGEVWRDLSQRRAVHG